MNAPIKPRRPQGRLPQLSKILHLQARRLGQWKPEPQVARAESETRYSLEEKLWRE